MTYTVWLFAAHSERTRPHHFYLGPQGEKWDRETAIEHGFEGDLDQAHSEAISRSIYQPDADTIASHTIETNTRPIPFMSTTRTYTLKTQQTVVTGEKLPTTTAIPLNKAEEATCQRYARLLAAVKKIDAMADSLKGDVVAIVNRCGPQIFQHGRLIPSWSNSYPVPSLEEWTGRVEKQRNVFGAIKSAFLQKAHGQPLLIAEIQQEKGISDATLAALDEPFYPVTAYIQERATLQQMEAWTHYVSEYEKCEQWMTEMKTFFNAAGVIIPKKSPGVKRLESNPPPARRKVPKVIPDDKGQPVSIVVDDIPM